MLNAVVARTVQGVASGVYLVWAEAVTQIIFSNSLSNLLPLSWTIMPDSAIR
jgi:hypothetical protein